jgi:hypothetical protein
MRALIVFMVVASFYGPRDRAGCWHQMEIG